MKSHLKLLATPKSWRVDRKEFTFVTRHNPGAHPHKQSMPLSLVLKHLLKITKTTKECKLVINRQEVLVDGKRRKDVAYPVGLLDVISFPALKEAYRIVLDEKAYLVAKKIDAKEAALKPVKLLGKTLLKGGKVQLTTSAGRSLIVDKDTFKTGDTLILSLPKQEIKEHLPFAKKALVYLTGGTHAGAVGEVVDTKNQNIILKTKEGQQVETLKAYAFVIGKTKPVITL